MTVLTSEYTVESIIKLYKENIRTSFDEKIVTLEGFYKKTGTQLYGTSYYDKLYDEDKTNSITIAVKSTHREHLVSGQYYRFHGYVNRGNLLLKDGAIQLIYRITRIIDHLDEYQFISKDEFNLIRQRFDKNSVDIQGYLLDIIRNDKQPNIHIILGSTSIVDEDYKDQLKQDHIFNITEERISFSNSSLLTNSLSVNDTPDIDLIMCMRGGGSGLEVFNNMLLAEQVIELKTPFVTALGHKSDLTMLERMADRGFATPTAFGSFLTSIQQQYKQETQDLKKKETEILDLKKRIVALAEAHQKSETRYIKKEQKLELKHSRDKEQLDRLYSEHNLQDKKVIKKLSIVLIIFILITGFTLWFFLKK